MTELSGQLDELMAEVRRQQAEVQRVQQSVNELRVTGRCRGDDITATLVGTGRFTEIHVEPEVLRRYQPHEIEDMVREAVNDALTRLAQATQEKFAPFVAASTGTAARPSGAVGAAGTLAP